MKSGSYPGSGLSVIVPRSARTGLGKNVFVRGLKTMATKHQQQTYECRHCHELYEAHPATNWMCLQGQCWHCLYVLNLSASTMDHYLTGIEQEMVYEGYDIPLEGDC